MCAASPAGHARRLPGASSRRGRRRRRPLKVLRGRLARRAEAETARQAGGERGWDATGAAFLKGQAGPRGGVWPRLAPSAALDGGLDALDCWGVAFCPLALLPALLT